MVHQPRKRYLHTQTVKYGGSVKKDMIIPQSLQPELEETVDAPTVLEERSWQGSMIWQHWSQCLQISGIRPWTETWGQIWSRQDPPKEPGGNVPTDMFGMPWFIPGQEVENAAVRSVPEKFGKSNKKDMIQSCRNSEKVDISNMPEQNSPLYCKVNIRN